MPGNQVDAMKNKEQIPGRYNPDARPLKKLLEGVTRLPPRREIVVDKPGFRLELRQTAEPS